ncbi:hypothetical protein ACWKWU_10225 [Chitinophaga lutea]
MQKIVLAALTAASLLACRKNDRTDAPLPDPYRHPDFTGEWKATQSKPARGGTWRPMEASTVHTLNLKAADSTFDLSSWGTGTFKMTLIVSESEGAHYRLALCKPSDTLRFKMRNAIDNKSFILTPFEITATTNSVMYLKQ